MGNDEPIEGLNFLDSCRTGLLRLFFGTPIQAVLSAVALLFLMMFGTPIGMLCFSVLAPEIEGHDRMYLWLPCMYGACGLLGLSLFIGICRALGGGGR